MTYRDARVEELRDQPPQQGQLGYMNLLLYTLNLITHAARGEGIQLTLEIPSRHLPPNPHPVTATPESRSVGTSLPVSEATTF